MKTCIKDVHHACNSRLCWVSKLYGVCPLESKYLCTAAAHNTVHFADTEMCCAGVVLNAIIRGQWTLFCQKCDVHPATKGLITVSQLVCIHVCT